SISRWWHFEMRSSASRSNATARSRPKCHQREMQRCSRPLQQQKFRAEARSKRRRHCVFPGLERPLFQPLLQDEKDGGAREVSEVSKNVPGGLRVTLA